MEASHTRRRILGDLDVNARSPAVLGSKSSPLKPQRKSSDVAGVKRLTESSQEDQGHPAKKPRTSMLASTPPASASQHSNSDRERSVSPDTSSIFDNSAIDTSQATTLTEPDTETTTIAPPSTSAVGRQRLRPLTREETRQKAEILRLRLGLARYKLRTGQEDVPLERLKVRPIPTLPRLPPSQPSSQDSSESLQSMDYDHDHDHDSSYTWHAGSQSSKASPSCTAAQEKQPRAPASPEKRLALPPLPSTVLDTPKRTRLLEEDEEERLTSSVMRGGAAKGLLSLARG